MGELVATCLSDDVRSAVQIATELQRPAEATRWRTVLETLPEATDRVFRPGLSADCGAGHHSPGSPIPG